MSVEKIKHKRRKSPIGDMDTRIILHNRKLIPPKSGESEFDEKFTSTKSVWANVNTVTGKTIFTSANVDVALTHQIIMRHDPAVTSETWIEFGGQRLKIVSSENLDERSIYMKLKCNIRGSIDTRAAMA